MTLSVRQPANGIIIASRSTTTLLASVERGLETRSLMFSPKGIRHLAQGCRYSGYPGLWLRDSESTPTGLCPFFNPRGIAHLKGTTPLGLVCLSYREPRVAAKAATLG